MINAAKSDFFNSYKIIMEDFADVCEYIAPVQKNFSTYSHRNYKILLSICTEFESVCKQIIIEKELLGRKPKNNYFYTI